MPKTILITGCSSGFGLAMVKNFLADGWQVIATARNPENNEHLTKLQNPSLTLLKLDITNAEQRQNVQQFIAEKLNNQLDCLVNNAGMGFIGLFEEFSEQQIRQQFEVNLIGLMLFTQLCLPALRNNKGKIINISSALGFFATPMYSIYAASKYAVEGFSESLYYELISQGVQVALIEPGSIKTQFDRNVLFANNKIDDPIYIKQNNSLSNMRKKLDQYDSDATAEDISEITVKLANTKIMPLRTQVGRDSKSVYLLRKILPLGLFIKLVKSYLNKFYSL